MAKWYSKQRKSRYSADLKKHGFIPNYYQIIQGMKAPYSCVSGLTKCTFDDGCDTCTSPKGGTYVSMCIGEDYEEADFYICKKCAVRTFYPEAIRNQSWGADLTNLNQWKRKQNLQNNEFICDWCDAIVSDTCSCKGASCCIVNNGAEYYELIKAS